MSKMTDELCDELTAAAETRGEYVSLPPWGNRIRLDGEFSADELEALAYSLRKLRPQAAEAG